VHCLPVARVSLSQAYCGQSTDPDAVFDDASGCSCPWGAHYAGPLGADSCSVSVSTSRIAEVEVHLCVSCIIFECLLSSPRGVSCNYQHMSVQPNCHVLANCTTSTCWPPHLISVRALTTPRPRPRFTLVRPPPSPALCVLLPWMRFGYESCVSSVRILQLGYDTHQPGSCQGKCHDDPSLPCLMTAGVCYAKSDGACPPGTQDCSYK
jgi:hypothetical protein